MKRYQLFYLITILILISCVDRSEPIFINRTKKGGLYEINEDGKEFTFYNRNEKLKVDTSNAISFKNFEKLYSENAPMDGLAVLVIKLDESGTSKLSTMTKRNMNKQLCLVIEDKIVSAPQVSEQIVNGELELLMIKKDFDFLKNSFE